MKKLLLIFSILMASCGEVEGIPEASTLSITNNSTVPLREVKWNGVEFGLIEAGEQIVKQVEITQREGMISGPIMFKARNSGVIYSTREPVDCKYLRRANFRFSLETEVRDGLVTKQLKDL